MKTFSFFLLLLFFFDIFLFAGPKHSGTAPEILTLPSGAGSVGGIGGNHRLIGNTGAFEYSLSLAFPPGRGRMTPPVNLIYNSNSGNGAFGIGWSLSFPQISRKTSRGVPKYKHDDIFDLSIAGELIAQDAMQGNCQVFGLRHEYAFFRILYDKAQNFWQVWSKDGTYYRFGRTPNARIEEEERTAVWLMDSIQDTNQNQIFFRYHEDGTQRYLSQIFYGSERDSYAHVELELEKRQDVFRNHRTGFPVVTRFLYRGIKTYFAGHEFSQYRFCYTPDPLAGLSRLSRVERFKNSTAFPPLLFYYTEENIPGMASCVDMLTQYSIPYILGQDRFVEVADFNNDGLTDLLAFSSYKHQVWLNQGNGKWTLYPLHPEKNKAQGLGLEDMGVVLLDYNGDSKMDIVANGKESFQCYPGGKNNWETQERISPPELPLREINFSSPDVRFADINGDGLTDILWWAEGEQRYYFALPKRQGWDKRVYRAGSSSVPNVPIHFFQLHDIDGDGLVDLVDYNEIHPRYWANLGWGKWNAPKAMIGLPRLQAWKSDLLRFSDINGDGLTDALLIESDRISCWIGLGEGQFLPKQSIALPRTLPWTDPNRFRFTDMDGDGVRDILWFQSLKKGYAYIKIFSGNHPNLLHKIDNGIGGSTSIQYAVSTQEEHSKSSDLPFPVWLVKKISVSSGLGEEQSVQYSYSHGFYDGEEKEFRGFARIDEKSASGNNTRHNISFYHSGDSDLARALTGKLSFQSMQQQEVQKSLTLMESQYQWHAEKNTKRSGKGTFVFLAQSEERYYEGQENARTKKTQYTYDDYGNIREIYEQDADHPESGFLVEYEYYKEDRFLEKWVLNCTSKEAVYQGQTSQKNALVRAWKSYYDDCFRLCKEEIWASPEENTAQGHWMLLYKQEHDSWGNLVRFYDSLENLSQYEYDSYGIFPVSSTNPLHHTTKVSYDYSYGQIVKAITANQTVYEWQYDALGRPEVSFVQKEGKKEWMQRYLYQWGSKGQPGWVEVQSRIEFAKEDYHCTRSYYDGQLRSIQTRSQYQGQTCLVQNSIEFDNQGQIKHSYLPFYDKGMEYLPPANTRNRITMEYDVLGRLTKKIYPDKSFEVYKRQPCFLEFHDTEDTYPLSPHFNTPERFFYDIFGRTIQKDQVLEPNHLVRECYSYNIMGKLIKSQTGIEVKGEEEKKGANTTEYKYNTCGWILSQENINTGKNLYVWNNLGLMEKHTNGRGITISYQYDKAGRVIQKASDRVKSSVEYTYDQGEYGLGQLSCVSTLEQGVLQTRNRYSYNFLGQRIYEGVEILQDKKSMHLHRSYGIQGQLLSLQYGVDSIPASPLFEYQYSKEGFLKHIVQDKTPLATIDQWNEMGQWEKITFANGSWQNRKLDKRLRLEQSDSSILGKSILSRNFLGDVTGIQHGEKTEKFLYDPIQQLLEHQTNKRKETFAYDSLGNRVGLNQQKFEVKNQQIISTPEKKLLYDQGGYVTSITGSKDSLSFVHNDLGNLVQIKGSNKNHDYTYDYTGYRIKKEWKDSQSQETNTTYFFSSMNPAPGMGKSNSPTPDLLAYQQVLASQQRLPELEISKDSISLHLYLGYTPILRWENKTGIHYLHTDTFERIAAITDQQNQIQWQGEYSVYGKLIEERGTLKQPLRFPGQYSDEETGLFYNFHRYYDPDLGRYIQPDPLGLAGGKNCYSYAKNSPQNFIDPKGLVAAAAVVVIIPAIPLFQLALVIGVIYTAVLIIENPNNKINFSKFFENEATKNKSNSNTGVFPEATGDPSNGDDNDGDDDDDHYQYKERRTKQNSQESHNKNDKPNLQEAHKIAENKIGKKIELSKKDWDLIHNEIGKVKGVTNPKGTNRNADISKDQISEIIIQRFEMKSK